MTNTNKEETTHALEPKLEQLLVQLWNSYTKLNPQVADIYQLFIDQGEGQIINDHIAFRTLPFKGINIESMQKPFTDLGYTYKDTYHFKQKKLLANYFQHPNPLFPKIFISELKLEECSDQLQSIMHDLIKQVDLNHLNQDTLCYSGRIWEQQALPSKKTYETLLTESEYAAWLYVFGLIPNHFTMLVNALKQFDSLEAVNQFIKANGYALNDSGGEIKGTKQDLLIQSSTLAGKTIVHFQEDSVEIPTTYYEFAQRFSLPDNPDELYHGFVPGSADKIFESTNNR